MGYMNRKSNTQIDTSLELEGCECGLVLITHDDMKVDREQFINAVDGAVRFDADRSGRDNSVYLNGTFSKDHLLALYLMMEDES